MGLIESATYRWRIEGSTLHDRHENGYYGLDTLDDVTEENIEPAKEIFEEFDKMKV
jgi:hypothetical protein